MLLYLRCFKILDLSMIFNRNFDCSYYFKTHFVLIYLNFLLTLEVTATRVLNLRVLFIYVHKQIKRNGTVCFTLLCSSCLEKKQICCPLAHCEKIKRRAQGSFVLMYSYSGRTCFMFLIKTLISIIFKQIWWKMILIFVRKAAVSFRRLSHRASLCRREISEMTFDVLKRELTAANLNDVICIYAD